MHAAVSLLLIFLAFALSGKDEAELLRAIKNGDKQAFRLFYEHHHVQLLRYLLRMGIDRETARDIVQQAFIRIWEKRDGINEQQSLRAYMYRIVYTRSLNAIRDNARFDADNAAEMIVPSTDSPEQDTSETLLKEKIDAIIQLLPAKRRETFELCFIQQLTYREAAEIMQVSIKTVENQMAAALKTMRENLRDYL